MVKVSTSEDSIFLEFVMCVCLVDGGFCVLTLLYFFLGNRLCPLTKLLRHLMRLELHLGRTGSVLCICM